MIFPPAPARDQTPLAASRALHGRLQEVHEEVWEPLLARAGGESDHAEDRSGPALQPHFLPKAWPHVALMRSGQGCAQLNRQWDWPGHGHPAGQLGTRGACPKCYSQGHLPTMVYSAVGAAACMLPALRDAFGSLASGRCHFVLVSTQGWDTSPAPGPWTMACRAGLSLVPAKLPPTSDFCPTLSH